jgi:uncharacterized protein (DUF1501 family)
MTSRRAILKTLAAAGVISLCDAPLRAALANVSSERRLVIVVLRGALDGLAAVPPHGDTDYADVRGSLAIDKSAILDLDGFFGLHPALTNLKAMYDARELAVFHNICSPYRERSHFDGQNVLETGGRGPHLLQDGWLNRALRPMGLDQGEKALAISPSVPLLLNGAASATSWMPAVMPAPDAAFLAKLRSLYAHDTALSAALQSALDMAARAQAAMDDGPGNSGKTIQGTYGSLTPLFAGAGKLLADPGGPRIAVLDAGGWDTHFNEGAADGQLARRLGELDRALDALKSALGPVWNKTAVAVATEFGRTVRPNGTGGTDHGTAGAAFLLGGSVAGGAIHAEWTGLKPQALQDGRDQSPRTDLRALFKGLLAEHMGVPKAVLDASVFPDSSAVASLPQLIRA